MIQYRLLFRSAPITVRNLLKSSALFLSFIFFLPACTTVEKVSQDQIKSRYANLSPEEALKLTSERYTKAQDEQYDYYSPYNWKTATEGLTKAGKIAKQNPHDPEIFKKIFLVDRRIDSAKYIKGKLLTDFADLFEAKKVLQKNRAPSSFGSLYEKDAAKLEILIKDYESYTLGLASEGVNSRTIDVAAQKLLASMQALNIKVVKHNYLSSDVARLKEIEKREPKTIAPVTYQQAQAALKVANEFIENDVHNEPGVKHIADKFTFAVSHLDHVTQEVIALSRLEIEKLEKVVLQQENNLYQIGKALNGIDVRNLPLATQAESVIKTANNVLEHHTEKSSMIVELSEKNLLLKQQLQQRVSVDEDTNAKLKSKIQLLEIDIQELEKEREKLKEDMFALQQKNIDLAIQNAKLLADIETKAGKSSKVNKNSLGQKVAPINSTRNIIKSSRETRMDRITSRSQANLVEQ